MNKPFVTTFHEKPWRHYQIHVGQTDVEVALKAKSGIRVPSVTGIGNKTINKADPIKYWAQRTAVTAVDTLQAQYGADDGIFRNAERLEAAILAAGREVNAQSFVELYESQQTTMPWGYPDDLLNIVKQSEESIDAKMKAAQVRGQAIHKALEDYAESGKPFNPDDHPDEYRGYFQALAKWLVLWRPTFHGSEVVVGSARHRFGGRLDHHLTVEHSDYGRVLADLKTGKGKVYPVENFAQVEGYEIAAVESGYEPTNVRAVLAIGPDGNFEFRRSVANGEQFLRALAWFNDQKQIESDAKKAAKGEK